MSEVDTYIKKNVEIHQFAAEVARIISGIPQMPEFSSESMTVADASQLIGLPITAIRAGIVYGWLPIGVAFGKIVSSLVADIIMPPLGLLIGGIDFKQFAVTLRDAQGDIPAVVMHYGVFIQNVFDFLIVAFAIFMAIKLINKLNRKKEEPAAAPAPTKEEVLLTEIRDLLKEQNNRS